MTNSFRGRNVTVIKIWKKELQEAISSLNIHTLTSEYAQKHTQDDIKYMYGAQAKTHQPWMDERKKRELNAPYFYYEP